LTIDSILAPDCGVTDIFLWHQPGDEGSPKLIFISHRVYNSQPSAAQPASSRSVGLDAEKAMAVGPRAGAVAASLDAEQVAEQRDHEAVVQPAAARPTHHEGDDRQLFAVQVAEQLDGRVGSPGGDRPADEAALLLGDHLGADFLLELEGQPGPDRLNDGWRPAFLRVALSLEAALKEPTRSGRPAWRRSSSFRCPRSRRHRPPGG
jgi:hypothetical protein